MSLKARMHVMEGRSYTAHFIEQHHAGTLDWAEVVSSGSKPMARVAIALQGDTWLSGENARPKELQPRGADPRGHTPAHTKTTGIRGSEEAKNRLDALSKWFSLPHNWVKFDSANDSDTHR